MRPSQASANQSFEAADPATNISVALRSSRSTVVTSTYAPPVSRCVDCGIPIGPGAQRCRVHAAAQARIVMQGLRDSDTSELMRSWVGLNTREVAMKVGMPADTVNGLLAGVYRKVAARVRAGSSGMFDDPSMNPSDVETAVLELGVSMATQVTAQANAPHRADYLRVIGDTVIPFRRLERGRAGVGPGFPLAEHPVVNEIIANRAPRAGVLQTRRLGPHVRRVVAHLGIAAGAGVPVIREGSVHGVLSIATRGPQPSRELVRRLADVGRILEVALAVSR
jgi:hypothetical protein